MTDVKKVLSVGLCLALVAITMPLESGAVDVLPGPATCDRI